MAGTYPKEGRAAALLAIGGTGGIDLTVRLFTNPAVLSDDTSWLDIVEANYDGYAPYNSNGWSPPAIDTNGDAFILSPVIVFTRIAGAAQNTIVGYAVTIVSPSNAILLLTAELLVPSAPMILPTDQVPLRIKLTDRNVIA